MRWFYKKFDFVYMTTIFKFLEMLRQVVKTQANAFKQLIIFKAQRFMALFYKILNIVYK